MAATVLASAKSIVIADDTAFVRERFQSALESAGHHATTAASAPELLDRLRANAADVDLLVLDLQLPQARGIELVRAARRVPGFNATILVFSGTIASAEDVRALSSLDVAGYVNEYTSASHILPALTPYLHPDEHNRRSSPRVALGVPVSYRYGNTIAAGVTLNLSQGGLAIRTATPLTVDTSVRLRFRLPGGRREIKTKAQVTWADERVGMGLRFVGIPEADQAEVDGYVQSHFFSNRRA